MIMVPGRVQQWVLFLLSVCVTYLVLTTFGRNDLVVQRVSHTSEITQDFSNNDVVVQQQPHQQDNNQPEFIEYVNIPYENKMVESTPAAQKGNATENPFLEARKAGLISPDYDGQVYRQGCYFFLTSSYPKKLLAPRNVLEQLGCTQRLPDAFIVGVKKSGTTTLGRYLDLHSQISLADAARIPYNNSVDQVVKDFLDSMPYATPDQMILADYPGYYWTNRVWFFRVLPYLPTTPKVLVIMRDPALRAMSDYGHMQVLSQKIPEDEWLKNFQGDILRKTFQETVIKPDGTVNSSLAFIRKGMYAVYLADFANVIGKENMLLLNGNKFAKEPLTQLQRIEKFFNIDSFYHTGNFIFRRNKGFYCAKIKERPDVSCMGKAKGRHHNPVTEDVIIKLHDFYRPYNMRLQQDFKLTSDEFDWFLS